LGSQRTLAIIKPDAVGVLEQILVKARGETSDRMIWIISYDTILILRSHVKKKMKINKV